jgi:hypothetical protein
MSKDNEMQLEGIISIVMNTRHKDNPPTEKNFNDCAEQLRNANKEVLPVTDEEFDSIKRRLRQITVVTMDTGICLPDPTNKHQSWLPSRRADIDFFFWERYRIYLEREKHWNPRVISKLGQVSDEILDQCGDPTENAFHIRGLILGDVQSGKTSNYTALANKAADVGYDLIIVLAGIPELLRQQTQNRLDKELCGRQSNLYLDPNATAKYQPVGVGLYGNEKSIASFTSEANDFDAGVLKSNNLALNSVNCSILLVVKKNTKILNNLYKWLKSNNAINENGQIQKSLFLIDDEADNASINTHDPEADPTAINNAIRQLLQSFSKTTYIAVTATPFANIFIDPKNDTDLFPSDFIYALDAPTNYIGAERMFSATGDNQKMIAQINEDKFLEVFPDKHKKNLVVTSLPADMYEAAYYFLITNAIRDLRGDNTEHRSMMIHVSRFINVQNQVSDEIYGWLELVKSNLRNYSQQSLENAERIAPIHELHNVWDKFNCEQLSGIKWEVMLKEHLYRAIAPVEIRTINGSRKTMALDYANHQKDGLRVIAVGGNTLSRGLTLEGLVVSYFYRNTNMYDTLMQMGRWFGYRPNYDDLVKIWLSNDAIDWYGQICDATLDLRDQIYKMKMANQSPRDFGLKVRQNPGSLIVTARSKMRTAETINCPISVSGHLLETPRLIASIDTIKQNEELIKNFVKNLSVEGNLVSSDIFRTHGNYFWEKVSGDVVSELLRNFKTHPWHMSFNGTALADYVADEIPGKCWDVVLLNEAGEGHPYDKPIYCGNLQLTITKTEQRNITIKGNMLSVSGSKLRVGSGGCARIGLTREEVETAKNKYYADYNGKTVKPNMPDSAYLIEERNPILMIHILEAIYSGEPDVGYPKFLFALGVGFPSDERGNKTATYKVNLIELANWINNSDEEDE